MNFPTGIESGSSDFMTLFLSYELPNVYLLINNSLTIGQLRKQSKHEVMVGLQLGQLSMLRMHGIVFSTIIHD